MPSKLRSLSSEGKILLNIGLEGKSVLSNKCKHNLKSKIKSCLQFLFSSPDDELIDNGTPIKVDTRPSNAVESVSDLPQ